MATTFITYNFDVDNEGINEVGLDSDLSIEWDGVNGSPDAGCLFLDAAGRGLEKARTSIANTWEDFGIPSGNKVDSVKLITASFYTLGGITEILDPPVEGGYDGIKLRFISSGTQVVEIFSPEEIETLPWDEQGPGSLMPIAEEYAPYDTPIQFEIELAWQTQTFVAEWRIDSIVIELTYSPIDGEGEEIMPERATVYEVSQLGVETTPGTPVAATKRLLTTSFECDPVENFRQFRPMGFKIDTETQKGKGHSTVRYNGLLSYNDIVYILSSLLTYSAPSSSMTDNSVWVITGASGTFGFTVTDGVSTNVIAPSAYTAATLKTALEAASRVGYGNVLVTNPSANTYVVTFIAARATAGLTLGTPTGSPAPTIAAGATTPTNSRRWTFLPLYNAPDTTRKTYTLEKGIVGGGTLAERISRLLFTNMAITINKDEATINGDAIGYSIEESPDDPFTLTSLSVSADVPAMAVDPGKVSVFVGDEFVDATEDTLGRLVKCHQLEFSMGPTSQPAFTLNDQDESWSYSVEGVLEPVFRLTLQHDAVSQLLVSNAKQKKIQYLTIECKQGAIEGTGNAAWPYRILIQSPIKWQEPDRSDIDGVYGNILTARTHYDDGTGIGAFVGGPRIVVDNGIASL